MQTYLLLEVVEKGADFKFLRDTKSASLLFDNEIKEFTSDIYKHAVNLHCLTEELDSVTGEDRKENLRKQGEINAWYKTQLESLDEKFTKYLKLKH